MILKTKNKDVELHLNSLEHAEEEYKVLDDNREYLKEWLLIPYTITSLDIAKQVIEESVRRAEMGIQYIFNIRYKGEIVGSIGIYNIKKRHFTGEFGYWLIEKAQGKGIAFDACHALLSFSFKKVGLNRIMVLINTKNKLSLKLILSCGFNIDGRFLEATYRNGKFEDLYSASILRREFNK